MNMNNKRWGFAVLIILCLGLMLLSACGKAVIVNGKISSVNFEDLTITETCKLDYAKYFTIEKYGEYTLITIEKDKYLVVPEDADVPYNTPDNMVILTQPLNKTYLVSTSVLDLINKIDAMGNVRLSGTKQQDWYLDFAKEAMEQNEILYAGKYSAPDYELILSEGCNLAIENTMIYHNPETKEKLEELNIPVLVEKSSYEEHPLGRLEWIKLYGVLYNKEDIANNYFEKQVSTLNNLDCLESGKDELIHEEYQKRTSIAFFSVTANGSITVRKPGDYITKMIELAGGRYALDGFVIEEENALSTMNIQMEDFYAIANDADILIYNSTIEGEINSLNDIIAKNELFADFKAYQEGKVYCTGKNFFQESTGIAEFIIDLNNIILGNDTEFSYLKKLE